MFFCVFVYVRLYSLNRPNETSFMSDELVPNGCVNGTIRWDYPMGHGRVHFMNQNHKAMSVCIKGRFGMTIFTISDVTKGSPGTPMEKYTDGICYYKVI